MTRRSSAIAASGEWTDPDGARLPAGEVHAWHPGTNQTLCGLALSKSRLTRFSHLSWDDVRPDSGGAADAVQRLCPHCSAALGADRPRWTRTSPRP